MEERVFHYEQMCHFKNLFKYVQGQKGFPVGGGGGGERVCVFISEKYM